MRRFLLFSGDFYYPSGGMEDFVSDHDTLEEAKAAHVPESSMIWAHIYDTELRKIVLVTETGDPVTVDWQDKEEGD